MMAFVPREDVASTYFPAFICAIWFFSLKCLDSFLMLGHECHLGMAADLAASLVLAIAPQLVLPPLAGLYLRARDTFSQLRMDLRVDS